MMVALLTCITRPAAMIARVVRPRPPADPSVIAAGSTVRRATGAASAARRAAIIVCTAAPAAILTITDDPLPFPPPAPPGEPGLHAAPTPDLNLPVFPLGGPSLFAEHTPGGGGPRFASPGGGGGPGGFGGGGGTGGDGLVLTGVNPSVVVGANVLAGDGGIGGFGGVGGTQRAAPGPGGTGLLLTGTGGTVMINPGVTVQGGLNGDGTQRGDGISGCNLNITHNGTIIGGRALNLLSGTNLLTLGTGSVITGGIAIQTGTLAITPAAGG